MSRDSIRPYRAHAVLSCLGTVTELLDIPTCKRQKCINFALCATFAGIDYKNKIITLEDENIKLQIWLEI